MTRGRRALTSLGVALLAFSVILTAAGVVGFVYILRGSANGDSGPIGGAGGQEKVRTLLELGPPLVVAIGVMLGVGVYCIFAARRVDTV